MIHRKLILSGLLWCAWPAGPGVAQSVDTLVLSLSRAEELALGNHPFVSRARVDLRLARSRKTQASNARWFPALSLRNVWGPIPRARGEFTETGVLISPDTSTSFSDLRWFTEVQLQVLQPLYTFGRLDGLIDAAKAGVEASEAGVEVTSDEVRLQVRKLYWGVVLGEEMVRLTDDVLERLDEAEEQLQQQYDEGTATQNDLFKFAIFRYQVYKGRREAVDGLAMAEAALRGATGLEDGVLFRTEVRELTPLTFQLDGVDRHIGMALETRPELAQLRAGISARTSLARSKRSEYWPQLFLGADVRWNRAPSRFDPRNPFWRNNTNFFRPGIVLGFSWDINLLQTRSQVRIAEHEAAQLSQQMDPLVEKIRLDVRDAHLRVVRATADVEESEEAVTAAENWFRAESQTFDLGLSEIRDLVDAFRAKVEMQTEHLRNIFELNTALADLSRAVGRDLYPN